MSIVEFQTGDGTPVLVKVSDSVQGELVTRGIGDSGIVQRAERTFEAALSPIRAVSEGLLGELKSVGRQPDTVSVEFGLEFTANSSAVLVGATGAASIHVTLGWQAPPPSGPAS